MLTLTYWLLAPAYYHLLKILEQKLELIWPDGKLFKGNISSFAEDEEGEKNSNQIPLPFELFSLETFANV